MGVDAVEVGRRCDSCGGSHGRPTLEIRGSMPLWGSLARSGDVAAVAVSTAPVGVDVERRTEELPDPGAVLAPGEDAADVLLAWVRKEAALKAAGVGLLDDPRRLDVSRDDVRWIGRDGRRRRALVRTAHDADGLVVAVATARGWVR